MDSLPTALIIGLLIIAVVILNLVIWAIYRGLRHPGQSSSTAPLGRFGQSLTQSPFQSEDRDLKALHDRVSHLNPPTINHEPTEKQSDHEKHENFRN
jgi:hypothetical protein